MAHGGYDKRRVAGRKPVNKATNNRPKSLGIEKKPKAKLGSLKRQIRSTERLLRKDTRPEVKEALTKKLEGLKNQQQVQDNLALERKIFLRDRKIKFFERRKVERTIRRLEKQQRASSGQAEETEIVEQLSKLKEDLEYIRFFPKTEKYVSLFKKGDNMETVVDKRNSLRTQIKANIAAAVASGKDLEETGSDDDGLDLSEDDFFVSGSSSDEADADDEWTDKSAREQASSASGKAASGMSSDERNQRHISARALMPPPRASNGSNAVHVKSRYSNNSFNKNSSFRRGDISSSSNTSTSFERPSFKNRKPLESHTHNTNTGNSSSNLSSNSDARKPKRKRRPKKKKQQA